MITARAVSARVVASATTGSESNDSAISVAFTPFSFYNAYLTESGPVVNEDFPFYTRYMRDTDDPLYLYVALSRPALGGETVTITEDFAEWENTESSAGDFRAISGVGTHVLSEGQTQIVITYRPKVRAGWFFPRRTLFRLSVGTGLRLVDNRARACVVLFSEKIPPSIEFDTPAASLSGFAGGNVSYDFNVIDPNTSGLASAASRIDPITVTFRVTDGSGNVATGITASQGAVAAGANTGTMVVTVDPGTAAGSFTVTAWMERYGELYQAVTVDPISGQYERTYSVHLDENHWLWTNNIYYGSGEHGDLGALDPFGQNTGLGKHTVPGFPTTHVADGSVEFFVGEPQHDIFEQYDTDVADRVEDPVTGDDLRFAVPSTNVSTGNPYIRESFNSVFCGGELTAHKMQHWVRAAMRLEPFTAGMGDHQHDFFRVGYRCRTANRNHGVSMRWRRVALGAANPAFGDSTPATASFTLSSDPTGESITLTDYVGTTKTFEFGFSSGAPNVEVPVPLDPLSMDDWIQTLVNTINGQGASFRMTATNTGGGSMSIAQDAARPEINTATAYGARPITYSTKTVWSVAPDNFRTESLVDSYGRYMGPASAGGTNVQYFYDATTNCEIWFWHRFNLWNKPASYVPGTDAYLDTGSDDAWGTWYGAARNETGLVVWALNYVPARDSNEVYQYSDGTNEQNTYIQMYPTKTEAPPGTIGYFSEEGGSVDPSTGETTSGLHGYEYILEYKGNSIQYPLWSNASDGSDIVNLNTIRTNRLGMLWHSQQVNFSPTRTPEISGEPTVFWPKMAPIWRPRGDACSGELSRDTATLTVI